jgi:monolysocardiolipin acyltransferase
MTSKQLAIQRRMRWGLAAYDICYRRKLDSAIITLGKCVPTIRGAGVYQRAVDFAIERLDEGDWVHVFPEGRVNMERQDIYRLKWGIGRILAECKKPPILLPFWHTGLF